MAIHTVEAGKNGAYVDGSGNKLKLTANTVDTIEFTSNLANVEVFGDATEDLYFIVDPEPGEEPTVGGANCWIIPKGGGANSLVLPSKKNAPTVVKLKSAGTPTYFVAKALV